MDKLGDLSDEELLARLRGHVGKGNVWCAELIAHLVEVDERRLDRVHACSSMWDFCTRKLGMSESEAQRRIAAARTVRHFPQVLEYIARGEVHLCALYALRKHLTNDNVDELLREASGKSTREVEKMLAARFPRPDVPACVEAVAPQAPLSAASPVSVATPSPMPVLPTPSGAASDWSLALAALPAPGPRPRVEPLSRTRYRIELTVSAGTKEAIDRIKDLMLHRNPTGDLETILDASLALLLAQLERERLGKSPRPKRRKPTEATNAHASSALAHAERTTRAPTVPVRLEPTASAPAAHMPSEAGTHDTSGLARLEPTADAPAARGRSKVAHDTSALAQLEPTADAPAARGRSKVAHDTSALARGESTASGLGIPVRSETRAQAPCAHGHADAGAPIGNQGESPREPSNAEQSMPKPADVEALLTAEVTTAARTTRPVAPTPATKASRAGSRNVPTELRREVFARDGDRCTYVGPDGGRCPARGYLELDHIRPKAHGGPETAANLRVRCRAHNALYAEQVFGRAHIASRMDLRRRKCALPPPASFETVARGLRSMGFREPEARRALETLAMQRDMEAAPVESILREALLVLT